MMKNTALAFVGLLALTPLPAMAASCSGTNCYKMNDGGGTLQSVKAITLSDGTVVQQTIPSDPTGTPFSATNQPPLPSGAATSAKQPALGVAGTPAADVLTMQGSPSGTPLPIGAASGALADGSDVAVGSRADAAAAFGASSASVIALMKAVATAEAPYQGVIALTAGTAGTAGRALRVVCTAAGNITVTYVDGSTDTIPVGVGLSYIAGAITTAAIPSSGGATATFANMK